MSRFDDIIKSKEKGYENRERERTFRRALENLKTQEDLPTSSSDEGAVITPDKLPTAELTTNLSEQTLPSESIQQPEQKKDKGTALKPMTPEERMSATIKDSL
jgi:hypothetical protein